MDLINGHMEYEVDLVVRKVFVLADDPCASVINILYCSFRYYVVQLCSVSCFLIQLYIVIQCVFVLKQS